MTEVVSFKKFRLISEEDTFVIAFFYSRHDFLYVIIQFL
ncbi:hypothetical protein CUZ93_1236 [Enterococcus xinjiangensis]|nr:hypothetical protein [Enterococcus lactis]MBL4997541.1 hypothetical protein [Enterococcus lactis]MBL5000301.1 hypothetical protein [Enterococcus lactis]